ncbi:MAG: alpha/beta fold hydrolase [Bauldia sp.]|uniref:alpha/beta fold hydrolase n=1 Tax=Bauldia sp. TaxID=2575872 RepID=UPI001DDC007F|nr:alpha/beta hydrolase [Bauldia sp.]MCB1496040.1 alpha/beta fold hydrolase [Bauldia sp.]
MIRSALTAIVLTAAMLAAPALTQAEEGKTETQTPTPAATAPDRSGHVEAGGISYYYEIRGQGEPLLLLHGGLGSIDMFQLLMPIFTGHRQVIAVDLQGHGRTELGNRPISLIDMGDDMATILDALGYGEVDVLGYSLGGGVALRLAVQHPDTVRRLAIVSAPFAQDGFFPEMLPQQAAVGAGMAEMMKETPMYKSYIAVAPHPEDFPRLLDAMGAYMRQPYDWADDVKTLKMPVMLVYGDSDMIRPEHIVEFYHLLGGGLRDAGWMRENMAQNRLAILPDLTHYEMFAAPALAHTTLPFLDGRSGATSWAEAVEGK